MFRIARDKDTISSGECFELKKAIAYNCYAIKFIYINLLQRGFFKFLSKS
jgi:hypothetical protein